MEWFWDQYLPDESAGREVFASPLRCKDLGGLPDSLVITAGYDPLYSEAVQYAEQMRQSGNRVEHINYEDMIHGFFRRSDLYDRAFEAVQLAGQKLNEVSFASKLKADFHYSSEAIRCKRFAISICRAKQLNKLK